jgi:two-component system, cell cycle sensor histidine kinase PleC
MLNAVIGVGQTNTLMGSYAVSLSEAVLRQRTRDAERTAKLEAQLANKIKSEFISNMSHELRTPLNSVLGFSKLLSEHENRRLSDDDIVEYASLVQDAATHLLTVINNILDISKLHSGSFILDPSDVQVTDAIDDSLTHFARQISDSGLNVTCNVANELPVIEGDEQKLRQVFINLIGNAVKFTPPGGSITIDAIFEPRGDIVVAVRDTGVGMSEEEIRVALAPFGQVDASRSRWREGSGLGLPIAKALVELHGGTIKISSLKGQGTEVLVRLPSTRDDDLSPF